MKNNDSIVTRLNFLLDINELREFYDTFKTQHQESKWTWDRNVIHVADHAKMECVSKEQTIMNGWPLQSNMADASIPPSILKTKHPTVPWYNTELMTGIAKRLQDRIPFSYRWTLFVLPPTGQVPKHVDIGEYVVHIPIYWGSDALFMLDDVPYTLPADGSSYVVDVEVPHETVNNSDEDRVGLIFRIPRDKLSELMAITGTI